MNGATAEPCESTIRAPNKAKKSSTGISQYFFLSRKKPQSSVANKIS